MPLRIRWFWNPAFWWLGQTCHIRPHCCRWCYVIGPLEITLKLPAEALEK